MNKYKNNPKIDVNASFQTTSELIRDHSSFRKTVAL